jgi:hypothetical protein
VKIDFIEVQKYYNESQKCNKLIYVTLKSSWIIEEEKQFDYPTMNFEGVKASITKGIMKTNVIKKFLYFKAYKGNEDVTKEP